MSGDFEPKRHRYFPATSSDLRPAELGYGAIWSWPGWINVGGAKPFSLEAVSILS